MRHIHDSRLHLRELHCTDLLDEAATVRLAAQASDTAPAFPAAWRARLTSVRQVLSGLRLPSVTSAARPAARPFLFR